MTRVALAAFLLMGVAGAAGAVGWAADGARCTVATKGESPMAKACAKGGRQAASQTMKEMVAKAKANGKTFTCDNCHKDRENFELTANAREDFKKLEAAQKK